MATHPYQPTELPLWSFLQAAPAIEEGDFPLTEDEFPPPESVIVVERKGPYKLRIVFDSESQLGIAQDLARAAYDLAVS